MDSNYHTTVSVFQKHFNIVINEYLQSTENLILLGLVHFVQPLTFKCKSDHIALHCLPSLESFC